MALGIRSISSSLSVALIGIALVSPVAAAPLDAFRLSQPRAVVVRGGTEVRGGVCRIGLGQPGVPVVRVERLDASGRRINSRDVVLVGSTRGRAGGCAYYAASLSTLAGPSHAGLFRICVVSVLSQQAGRCQTFKAELQGISGFR